MRNSGVQLATEPRSTTKADSDGFVEVKARSRGKEAEKRMGSPTAPNKNRFEGLETLGETSGEAQGKCETPKSSQATVSDSQGSSTSGGSTKEVSDIKEVAHSKQTTLMEVVTEEQVGGDLGQSAELEPIIIRFPSKWADVAEDEDEDMMAGRGTKGRPMDANATPDKGNKTKRRLLGDPAPEYQKVNTFSQLVPAAAERIAEALGTRLTENEDEPPDRGGGSNAGSRGSPTRTRMTSSPQRGNQPGAGELERQPDLATGSHVIGKTSGEVTRLDNAGSNFNTRQETGGKYRCSAADKQENSSDGERNDRARIRSMGDDRNFCGASRSYVGSRAEEMEGEGTTLDLAEI
ncbi:hypothetical protein R1sor_002990 [Riccia sorocarpa]|uniref:Uncharacterized protein n=1 Tax=Riccia sorocarpa TaxID=122646 RepID=A0ABD3H156_9MARC